MTSKKDDTAPKNSEPANSIATLKNAAKAIETPANDTAFYVLSDTSDEDSDAEIPQKWKNKKKCDRLKKKNNLSNLINVDEDEKESPMVVESKDNKNEDKKNHKVNATSTIMKMKKEHQVKALSTKMKKNHQVSATSTKMKKNHQWW